MKTSKIMPFKVGVFCITNDPSGSVSFEVSKRKGTQEPTIEEDGRHPKISFEEVEVSGYALAKIEIAIGDDVYCISSSGNDGKPMDGFSVWSRSGKTLNFRPIFGDPIPDTNGTIKNDLVFPIVGGVFLKEMEKAETGEGKMKNEETILVAL